MPRYAVTFSEVVSYTVEIEADYLPSDESDWFERVETQVPNWIEQCDVQTRELDYANPSDGGAS